MTIQGTLHIINGKFYLGVVETEATTSFPVKGVLNTDGSITITSGHARVDAAKRLGKPIPIELESDERA